MNPTEQLLDDIDRLTDEQMERWSRLETTTPDLCWHCGRDWHGLAITERMEQMRRAHLQRLYEAQESGEEHGFAESVIDPDYRYADDTSTVLCPGSAFIGPVAAPPVCGCDNCRGVGNVTNAAILEFANAATRRIIQLHLTAISPHLAELLGVDPVGHLPDGSVAVAVGPDPLWTIPDDVFDPASAGWSFAGTTGEDRPADPEPEPEPPPANPDRFAHLPLLPRPSTRPPMWARRADGRRR